MGQSRPYNPPQRPEGSPYRHSQAAPLGQPQPSGGGWMRGLGAGIAGGFLGSMLFGGMSHGGLGGAGGAGGGGGIGFFEILLFAGLAYLAFRFFKTRQQMTAGGPSDAGTATPYSRYSPSPFSTPPAIPQSPAQTEDATALLNRVDPQFNVTQFLNDRLDDFFRLQAAWANRDVSPVQSRLTPEMFSTLSLDAAALRAANQINKLDNIAVRTTEIVEAWEELGRVFVTVLLTASLIDYTTDERTNEVVAGSKTEPVKFQECWTFTRDIGFSAQHPQWRLTAIEQQ